jgi:hypothetical protein
LLASGAAEIRTRSETRFKEPNLHARLIRRIVMGRTVIDHEQVTRTFPEGPGTIELVAIYEVRDGKITTASFMFGPKTLQAANQESSPLVARPVNVAPLPVGEAEGPSMLPYEPRPIRFLEIWEIENWRLKLYGISHGRALPRVELIAAARQIAVRQLRSIPNSLPHYRLGFLGVHEGRGSNFVFLDFWANENELHHHVSVSPTESPADFTCVTPTGLSACVWDLRLQSFERDAWVTHVLQCPESPDFDGYLAARLNIDV